MTGLVDTNLVLGAINPQDALHERARVHLEGHSDLQVPFSVGIELLLVAKKHGVGFVEIIAAAESHFELERAEVLYVAAESLDTGEIATVFDAVHLSQAHHGGTRLHTADQELLDSPYPTHPF